MIPASAARPGTKRITTASPARKRFGVGIADRNFKGPFYTLGHVRYRQKREHRGCVEFDRDVRRERDRLLGPSRAGYDQKSQPSSRSGRGARVTHPALCDEAKEFGLTFGFTRERPVAARDGQIGALEHFFQF